MPNRYYSSTAQATTLNGGINSTDTTIVVAATTGFPGSFPYTLAIDTGTATEELVTVTAGAGTTLTITRGQDGTAPVSHSTGAAVEHVHSARDFTEPQAHMDATVAHGATGAVVGTTNTQTLTNKTLTAPVVGDFTNATHTHDNAAGGGQLTDAALSAPVTVPKGGTGVAALTASRFLVGSGTAAVDLTKVVPSGDVVGTTDTQTLTNKTISAANNTLNLAAKIQAGSVTATVAAVDTRYSMAVTFPTAFPSAPQVVVTPVVTGPETAFVSVANVTTTGFTLWYYRSVTASDIPVGWIAMVP